MIGFEPTDKIIVNIPASVKQQLKHIAVDRCVSLSQLLNGLIVCGMAAEGYSVEDAVEVKAKRLDIIAERTLALIKRHGALKRTALVRALHLDKVATDAIIERLLQAGSIAVERHDREPKGRPTTIYIAL